MTDSAPAGGYLSRHRGPVSLALAGGGLLACEAAIWAGWLPGAEGRVLATGMDCIPTREQAGALRQQYAFIPYPDPGLRDKAFRILNVYDQEVCCAGGSCTTDMAHE